MCNHLLRYYVDAYPAAEVSDFIAAGLEAGDTCLSVLTAARRQAVEQCLLERGVRPDAAGFVVADTDEVLAQLLVDGRLALDRATEMLAPLMRPSGSARRVRLVGDLAPELLAAGHIDDAIALEDLVHRLAQEHGAAVICAYPIPAFIRHADLHTVLRLSAQHARVEFPERIWIQDSLQPAPDSARTAREGTG